MCQAEEKTAEAVTMMSRCAGLQPGLNAWKITERYWLPPFVRIVI
jgi:hypothetical protein